jgi:RarD protein
MWPSAFPTPEFNLRGLFTSDDTIPQKVSPHMPEPAKGVWAMIGACTIWGFAPIMYKELSHVPAVEVLAHRTFWSLAFFAAILAVQGRIGVLRAAFSQPREVALMAIAAGFITVNWFLFIWAVPNNFAVEAPLGYYIFPLVAVLIGRVVFGERLSGVQWGAVAIFGERFGVWHGGTFAIIWLALSIQHPASARVSDLLCMNNLVHASATKEHDNDDNFQGLIRPTS